MVKGIIIELKIHKKNNSTRSDEAYSIPKKLSNPIIPDTKPNLGKKMNMISI